MSVALSAFNNPPSMKTRWGILSTASIANKVVRAIQSSQTGEVVAVASRNLEKAAKFAAAHNIKVAYGTYDELLKDPSVQCVYIPLPSGMKREWGIKAAEHGKHILVEKPFCSEADVQALYDACKRCGVAFMDGTMWVHHDRARVVLQLIT